MTEQPFSYDKPNRCQQRIFQQKTNQPTLRSYFVGMDFPSGHYTAKKLKSTFYSCCRYAEASVQSLEPEKKKNSQAVLLLQFFSVSDSSHNSVFAQSQSGLDFRVTEQLLHLLLFPAKLGVSLKSYITHKPCYCNFPPVYCTSSCKSQPLPKFH